MGRKNKTHSDDYYNDSQHDNNDPTSVDNDYYLQEENVNKKLNDRNYEDIAMTIFHNLQDRVDDMGIEVMTNAQLTDFIDFIKHFDTQNYNFNDEIQ